MFYVWSFVRTIKLQGRYVPSSYFLQNWSKPSCFVVCCFSNKLLLGFKFVPHSWRGREKKSEVEVRMQALKLGKAELLKYLLRLPRCDLDKPFLETHLAD